MVADNKEVEGMEKEIRSLSGEKFVYSFMHTSFIYIQQIFMKCFGLSSMFGGWELLYIWVNIMSRRDSSL